VADLQVDEFTRLTGLPEGWANSEATQRVVLWDKGPDRPVPPRRPIPPKGNPGEPEYDLAMIEFRESLEDYEKGLLAYRKAKIDYEKFMQDYGGPYEVTMWSVDASDSLARDPTRYCISSKTRGYSRLKNRGLPAGVSPGHGQAAAEERAKQADVDMEALRRSDPVFGSSERAA
jgi:hypothetical protein